MTAWGDWHTPKVTFTLDKTKSVKLRVCVEHEDGGWGAVDVLYLHKDASSSEGKDDTNTSGSSSSGGSSSGSAATVTPSDDTKKDDKPEQTTESKNVTATTGRDFCRYGEQDRGSCRNRPCGNYCKCYR